jgi:sialic acid synthase SpsE
MTNKELFDEVYISTGAMPVSEYVDYATIDKVTLLHCVSSYPCNMSNINLPKMDFLKSICKKVGYSGHYQGIYDAIAAICKEAVVVEKHFTINHDLPGRDNKFALLPDQFKQINIFRNNFESMAVNCGLNMQDCEKDYRKCQKGRWNH